MVEPVSIVGGVAASFHLAEFGYKLVRRLSDLPDDIRSSPESIQSLMEDVEGVLHWAHTFKLNPAKSGDLALLESLIKRFAHSAISIRKLLQPLLVTKDDKRPVRFGKSCTYQFRKKRIARLSKDMDRYQTRLTLYLTSLSYHGIESASSNHTPPPSDFSKTFISHLPPKSDHVGRESVLDSLAQAFANPSSGHRACLVGIGGIGKTQTALEYLSHFRTVEPTSSVLWIQATNKTTLNRSFLSIARDLQILGVDESDTLAVQNVVHWLESPGSGKWILVFDDIDLPNFDDPAILTAILPTINTGSVLFTTRNHQSARRLVPSQSIIQMEPMSPGEATQLLNSYPSPPMSNQEKSQLLLQHLNFLPRAISQVAAYIRLNSMPLESYLRLCEDSEESKATLLTDSYSCPGPSSSVLLIESLLPMNTIHRQISMATDLLFDMACMDQESVPKELISTDRNPQDLSRALNLLRSYCLIDANELDDMFTIHPLVRLALRTFLTSKNEFGPRTQNMFSIISKKFPVESEQHHQLSKCSTYFPHAISLWKSTVVSPPRHSAPAIDSSTAETLASRLSRHLRTLGKYSEAKFFASYALSLIPSDTSDTPSRRRALSHRNNLAFIYMQLGHHQTSTSILDSILDVSPRLLLHPDTKATLITTLNRKGLTLQSQGLYSDAEPFHQYALHLCTTLHPPHHPKTLDKRHALALSLLGQKNYTSAHHLLTRVYIQSRASLGAHSQKTLNYLCNLSSALQLLGRWQEAHSHLCLAIRGYETIHGPTHIRTLQAKANLAEIYLQYGDLGGAESVIRFAHREHEGQLGSDHPLSLQMLETMGLVFVEQGRWEEAVEVFGSVVRGREKGVGREHCETVRAMRYLAGVYRTLGAVRQALEVGRNVVEVQRRTLREHDRDRMEGESFVLELEQGQSLS